MPTTDQTLRPATSLLVVDDDPDMLRLLSMRLTAAGYRVMAVARDHAREQVHRP